MRSPLDTLREAVEAFRADTARERMHRWRGAPDAASAEEVARRHDWLTGAGARAALDEARSMNLAGAPELAALEAHLNDARRQAALAPARDRLAAMGTGLPKAPADALGFIFDARAHAAAIHAAASDPDAGPPWPDLVEHARGLLDATDELAQEAVESLVPRLPTGHPLTMDALVDTLRAPELDGLFPPRDRFRRVARDIHALGFERALSDRVRAEPGHGEPGLGAAVAIVDAPRDVRLAIPADERGLASEIAAADGVGRALACCLIAPGLPVELRRPVTGSVARAMGTVLAQNLLERPLLERLRGLDRREAERVARLGAVVALLEARVHATSLLLVEEVGASLEAQRDRAPDMARRALRVEVPVAHACLFGGTAAGVAVRYRGCVSGLAAWDALRARYDEDWCRNPRAAEALRAGAHRGGWLSAEAWAADELGAEPGADVGRLSELLTR